MIIIFLSKACRSKDSTRTAQLVKELQLKQGEVVACGPPDQQFGTVTFDLSCDKSLNKDFNLGLALLHSFEYDESEKVFAKIINAAPDCSMAYWGVAMSNFHPLWTAPTEPELIKGSKALEIARSLPAKSERETAYIEAIGKFFDEWQSTSHAARTILFEKAMEQLHAKFPDDKEATLFYALALDASANPTDKTFSNQKKAADLLNAFYTSSPNHPGVIHYIIHTYDYPGLASLGLAAAKKYASVAPSSAHALHMPSHIFTRLGLWDEAITSNRASVNAAICYAQSTGIKGHWDEELHGLDYLTYAYLQQRNNDSAKAQLKYLQTFENVSPVNFKVAYAFAAIPSRIALENKNWAEAAALQLHPLKPGWSKFPWQEAIIHYTRAMGSIHLNDLKAARAEIAKLNELHDTLLNQKDTYKAKQVEVQIITANAWLTFQSGNKELATAMMRSAANLEDSTEKHPVTPGEVLPARELLGDMFVAMNQPKDAVREYSAVLEKSPNRYNTLTAIKAISR